MFKLVTVTQILKVLQSVTTRKLLAKFSKGNVIMEVLWKIADLEDST